MYFYLLMSAEMDCFFSSFLSLPTQFFSSRFVSILPAGCRSLCPVSFIIPFSWCLFCRLSSPSLSSSCVMSWFCYNVIASMSIQEFLICIDCLFFISHTQFLGFRFAVVKLTFLRLQHNWNLRTRIKTWKKYEVLPYNELQVVKPEREGGYLVVTGNVHNQFPFVTMSYIKQPLYIKLVSLCVY